MSGTKLVQFNETSMQINKKFKVAHFQIDVWYVLSINNSIQPIVTMKLLVFE